MKSLMLMIAGFAITTYTFAQSTSYASLAEQAQEKLHDDFRSSSGSYYIENNGTSNTYFHYWWNAHALDVLVDGYLRTNDNKYLTRINTLVSNWSNNNGGTIYKDFYDDMEWFALSLFRVYESTGNTDFLNISTSIWDDIKTGKNGQQGGGIAWKKDQLDYKNVAANAPAIIYACRRHQMWGHSWELDLANELYTWLKSTLVTPDGRVRDGINREGNGLVDDWQFTYNYGVFVGAALEMYQSTGNTSYLNDAITSADYAIQHAGLTTNGIFKNEGDRDAGLFKGILVRYLTLLSEETAVSSAKRDYYKDILEDQAESIATVGFNNNSKLIGLDWAQTAGTSTWMSAQLSGIMMLEMAANLGFNIPQTSGVVTLFEGCNYGGYAISLAAGSYSLDQLEAMGVINDDISSIEVQNGFEAVLYQHHDFSGNVLVKSASDDCLVNDNFNDDVSSLVVSQSSSNSAESLSNNGNLQENSIFPNPVKRGSDLRIHLESPQLQSEVRLLDFMGNLIYHVPETSGSEVVISTGTMLSGTYLLQVIAEGQVKAKKVIIN